MADLDIYDQPKWRVSGNIPLPKAIQLLMQQPEDDAVKPYLSQLADELRYRTAHCPDSLTIEAVGKSIGMLLGQMLDRRPFSRRHQVALAYLGVNLT